MIRFIKLNGTPRYVETGYSEDAAFWTGEGWYAALGGVDEGCKIEHGKTELDALNSLCWLLDCEEENQGLAIEV